MESKIRSLVLVAADSIEQLRRSDVYRVLDLSMDMGMFGAMADYICQHRPDLKTEVSACEADLKS